MPRGKPIRGRANAYLDQVASYKRLVSCCDDMVAEVEKILTKSGSKTPKSVAKNIRAAVLLHSSTVKQECTRLRRVFTLTTNTSVTVVERTVQSLQASGTVFPLIDNSDTSPSIPTPSPRRRKSKRKSKEDDTEQWFIVPHGKEFFDYNSYNKIRCQVPVESLPFFRSNVVSRNLVQCHKRTLFRWEKMYDEGITYLGPGRPRVMEIDEFKNEVNAMLTRNPNLSITDDDVRNILTTFVNKNLTNDKNDPNLEFDQKTIDSYLLIASTIPGVVDVGRTKYKTETRIMSENSIRSAVSFLFAVAGTHLVISTNTKWDATLSNATDGAKKLARLVSKVNDGVIITPIPPSNITSTDESGGLVGKNQIARTTSSSIKLKMESTDSTLNAKNKQLYIPYTLKMDNNGNDFQTGIGAKLTHTFKGDGSSAPPFVQIKVTDRQLPPVTCKKGWVLLKIQGLCSYPHLVNSSTAVGYILIVTGSVDDKQISDIYDKEVYIPFIKDSRWAMGVLEPDENTKVVSWCDGAIGQLKSRTDPNMMKMFGDNFIESMKQSNARTGVEQAADLSRVFFSINEMMRNGKYLKLPAIHTTLTSIENALNEAKRDHGLDLGAKRSILVQYISRLPNILSKTVHASDIQNGFAANGMLDANTLTWPDYDAIMLTLKRKLTEEEDMLITKNFQVLYNEMLEHGHISEDVFDELGFEKDCDRNGNEVDKDLSQESRHRAKWLSHSIQKEVRAAQRESRLQKMHEKQTNLLVTVRHRTDEAIMNNAECELRVGARLRATYVDETMSPDTRNAWFDNMKTDCGLYKPELLKKCKTEHWINADNRQLSAFIIVRRFEKYPENGKHGLSSKNKEELVKMCIDMAERPRILKHAT